MSKITIIEGNSNSKDNVRNFMVKGETGAGATIDVVKENGVATITINDSEGTKTFTLSDGEMTRAMVIDDLLHTDTDLPLSANQGKELKDLVDEKANSTDVYAKNETYSQTEINTALSSKASKSDLSSYKLKGDFAVLTKSAMISSSQAINESVEFPTGFNMDNTVVIAAQLKIDSIDNDGSTMTPVGTYLKAPGSAYNPAVNVGFSFVNSTSYINYSSHEYFSTPAYPSSYYLTATVVLMKTN